MSVLLGHIKTLRALAAAYDEQAELIPEGGWAKRIMRAHARAHRNAALALEDLMRAEAGAGEAEKPK